MDYDLNLTGGIRTIDPIDYQFAIEYTVTNGRGYHDSEYGATRRFYESIIALDPKSPDSSGGSPLDILSSILGPNVIIFEFPIQPVEESNLLETLPDGIYMDSLMNGKNRDQ